MQKKTIHKIIQKKMLGWLNTLPKELAKSVKSNILVSGGSIASMFLKEPVNDYDVYIQDIDVLIDLAYHYAKPKGVSILDGRNKKDYILDLEEETGGFSIKENASEYAIRIKNLKNDRVMLDIGGAGSSFDIEGVENIADDVFVPLFMSQNAISLTNDVQIVLRFSGNHEEIHKNFDFIHATNYWTFNEGLVTNIEAVESLLTKQLKYQGSLYPLTSVIRMKKFILRGWKISAGEILKMLYQTSKLNLDDPEVLEDQLIGIDIAYFSILIKLLSTYKKEGKSIENYIMGAIDKVFNEIDLNDEQENN